MIYTDDTALVDIKKKQKIITGKNNAIINELNILAVFQMNYRKLRA